MPAQDSKINLLLTDPFESSFGGKFLKWALSVGRYIVIATELVVILSFLSRFKLDRDLTDLNEAAAEKEAVLAAYDQLETEYRALADRLELVKQLDQEGLGGKEDLDSLSQVTPIEVSFSNIKLAGDQLELAGRAASERGLAGLLKAMGSKGGFTNILVSQISSSGEKGPGIDFRLTARRPK